MESRSIFPPAVDPCLTFSVRHGRRKPLYIVCAYNNSIQLASWHATNAHHRVWYAGSPMAFLLRRSGLWKLLAVTTVLIIARALFSSHDSTPTSLPQYHGYNVLERVTGMDKTLNVHKHRFLQARVGRDNRRDIFDDLIMDGVRDYWERFQVPM